MSKNIKINLGLLFGNAFLMGGLFLILGVFLVYITLDGFYDESPVYAFFLGLFFGILTIILGLIPITSFKHLIISEKDDVIIYGDSILFFFGSKKKYRRSEFSFIALGETNKQYKVGGGFLPTARNYYRVTEVDLYFYGDEGKKVLKIENIGNAKKAERIFNRIIKETGLKSQGKRI